MSRSICIMADFCLVWENASHQQNLGKLFTLQEMAARLTLDADSR